MKILDFLVLPFFLLTIFSCKSDYNITYELNGGQMSGDYKEKFSLEDDYQLPIPIKDGYTFIGWTENGIFIDVLEEKDYNLEANWILSNYIDYQYIEDFEIYNQLEEEYLVYFMRDGCSWCAKIKDEVLRYQYKTSLEQYSKNIKLYVVNLRSSSKSSKILRQYKGDDGEGTNFVNKATKWDELYISATPTLIKISTNNGNIKSEFLENGATKIKNRLLDYLIDKNDYSIKKNKNKVIYDVNGGVMDGPSIEQFFPWVVVDLPVPTKEGYTFMGWYENEKLIEKLENKNYNLVAKWEKTLESESIEKEQIFSKDDDNYYVLFLRHLHNIKEFIEVINQYNTYATDRGFPLIYIIDLDKCKEIYRTYDLNENGVYVNEATSWDQLYINERYTLINLSTVEGKKKASFIVQGVRNVPSYLEEKYGFMTK